VARYDKYDPISGGFRAPLNADLAATSKTGNGNPIYVSLNSSGRVVPGGDVGTATRVGVLCTIEDKKAGDIVDVMTSGEIVECAALAAGAIVTGLTTAPGTVDDVAADATHIRLGHTVEAERLIVRAT